MLMDLPRGYLCYLSHGFADTVVPMGTVKRTFMWSMY